MSKASRSVLTGFAKRESQMMAKWNRKQAAKAQDRLGLLRNKPKKVRP